MQTQQMFEIVKTKREFINSTINQSSAATFVNLSLNLCFVLEKGFKLDGKEMLHVHR